MSFDGLEDYFGGSSAKRSKRKSRASDDIFNISSDISFGGDFYAKPKKGRKRKGGFDDIYGFAGIGGQPFLGFSKNESQGDFVTPIKRKRRSKEAILLGIKDDARNPILGLQFMGNAVGTSERFLESPRTNRVTKKRVKDLRKSVGFQFGRFELDEQNRAIRTPLGKAKRSKRAEDTVIFGRALNPRIKSIIGKSRTKQALKKTIRTSVFGASPSTLITSDQVVLTRKGTRAKKERLDIITGVDDQASNFGQFATDIENQELETSIKNKKERLNKLKGQRVIQQITRGRLLKDPSRRSVLEAIDNPNPLTTSSGLLNPNRFIDEAEPVILIADGKKFRRKPNQRIPEQDTAGSTLLGDNLGGILGRLEKQSVKDRDTIGLDQSPIGSQAETRIGRAKKRKRTTEVGVGSLFDQPTTEIPDIPTESIAEPIAEQKSDFIFGASGEPVSLEKENSLLQAKRNKRPFVRKREVFDESDPLVTNVEDNISDDEFNTFGKFGSLPNEAQKFFDDKKQLTEEEKDKAGIVDDFGDIIEKASKAKDLGIGGQQQKFIPKQPKEEEFDMSFQQPKIRKGGDGIRPDSDARKSLKIDNFPTLSLINKIEKEDVNTRRIHIKDDLTKRDKFHDAITSGRVTRQGILDEIELTKDKDIPSSTGKRRRRELKNTLQVLDEFENRKGTTPRADSEIGSLRASNASKQTFEAKLDRIEGSGFRVDEQSDKAKRKLKQQVFQENAIVPVEELQGSTDRALISERVKRGKKAEFESQRSQFGGTNIVASSVTESDDTSLLQGIGTKLKRRFIASKKARENETTIEEEEDEMDDVKEKIEVLEAKESRELDRKLKEREEKEEREARLRKFREENPDV